MKTSRNIYIENIELEKARELYKNALNLEPSIECVSIDEALHRTSSKPVFARCSSPFYNASAMDGIMVIASKTDGATEVHPIILQASDFEYVNTGNPIKEPYNAVIMIEDVVTRDNGSIEIIKSAVPWQHIRPVGEDIVVHEMIIPLNHKIRAIDLGALVSGGIKEVKVYKKMKVGIVPTGTEIITDIDDIGVGKIIDSNSYMFEGLIHEYGGQAHRYKPEKDDYETLKKVIAQGVLENDMLVVNAGSSAGTKDYTVHIIRELGEVLVHGVAIKPGKPTILGIIDGKPVVGIPGYPVSAYIAFEKFVKPIVLSSIGESEKIQETIKVITSKRIVSSLKHEETVRVTLGYIEGKYIATPLSRGAGTTMSLVRGDGLLVVPKESEGIEAGQEVSVSLMKPIQHIKETLVSVGSHDLIMDIVGNQMPVSSGHVGSMGGIMAMKRRECHIAPIHLLDEVSGIYNESFVKKYFPKDSMVLIKGLQREQGLMVKKGNPKNIKGFKDLLRDDVQYVNRQRGAGTRLLLDYNLKQESIDSNAVKGYEREMLTHSGVAAAVDSGTADTGLGIRSVAQGMGLDFIPVAYEDYDFILYEDLLSDPKIRDFIRIMTSHEFKNYVLSLGGYNFKETGRVITI